jgi:prepilin-type N-terminal cleavage/methylation domain-containing protein
MLSRSQELPRRARGFSLVEMMISMVLGLIVIGAALVLVVSVVRANSETVRATQLTSELRATLGVVSKEVQRARLMRDPLLNVGNADEANNPNDLIDDNACLRFSYYDPDPDRNGTIEAATETNRAVSIGRVVVNGIGAIYADVDLDAAPLTPAGIAARVDTTLPACPDAGDVRLSSPELNVTRFCGLVIDTDPSVPAADRDRSATQAGCNVPASPEVGLGESSMVRLEVTGSLVGDTTGLNITRTVVENLRVGPSRLRNPAPPLPPPAPAP